jgi:NAD(P)-dependent dehydrogenase (short-subunit alcohol dehydrogenase family)
MSPRPDRFAGHVALVTGGGAGIGAAIARQFDAEGALVAVVDLNIERATDVAASLRRAIAVGCDVGQADEVRSAFEWTRAELGEVTILINNAGISGSLEQMERRAGAMAAYTDELLATVQAPRVAVDITANLTDDEWRRMMAVHVDGVFYATREALRGMIPRRRGSIVNMSSICALTGCIGAAAYSAAKAAVIGFTRAVAKEVAVHGIRVNAVAPGNVDTSLSVVRSSAERALTIAMTPLGRLGRPEEIAGTVAFLASDEASYFTGSVLSPNGGAAPA